jgi:hypothetical protein
MTGPSSRHVTPEGFDRYLAAQTPIHLPVPGTPDALIFIEPTRPELGLRIEMPEGEQPETGLSNIVSRAVMRGDRRFLEVVVTVSSLFRDAYPLLCAMADRVQLAGQSPIRALEETLSAMAMLLRAPELMSRDREIGLYGELLVLGGLVGPLGPKAALESWRGVQPEEHDFGLSGADLEVKATTGEQRRHWIESLTQLVPTANRPLWLVSHQLTTAGVGYGVSLPQLVDHIRPMLVSTRLRDAFDTGLRNRGWLEEERGQLQTRWTRRAGSRAYVVLDAFPRMTRDDLTATGFPMDRISDVQYRVDLDGLSQELDVPKIISTAIEFEGRS